MAAPTLDEVARELYLLPPAAFTAARNARRAELRASDRALADEVGALHRASPAAWLVTLLAHEQPTRIGELVTLGDELRQAVENADRDALARLSEERRDALRAAADAAGRLASEHEVRASRAVLDEVAETLQAAMGDTRAAGAVRSGLLVRPLEASGFDPVDLTGALAVEGDELLPSSEPPAPRLRRVKNADAELARARREAAEELETASAVLDDAREAVERLRARRSEARRRHDELETELAERELELQRTREDIRAAAHELRTIDADAGRAERALDAAERRHDEATTRRDRFR